MHFQKSLSSFHYESSEYLPNFKKESDVKHYKPKYHPTLFGTSARFANDYVPHKSKESAFSKKPTKSISTSKNFPSKFGYMGENWSFILNLTAFLLIITDNSIYYITKLYFNNKLMKGRRGFDNISIAHTKSSKTIKNKLNNNPER